MPVATAQHPSRGTIHALACATAPASALGVRSDGGGHASAASAAPMLYAAAGGHAVTLFDLADFSPRLAFTAHLAGGAGVEDGGGVSRGCCLCACLHCQVLAHSTGN